MKKLFIISSLFIITGFLIINVNGCAKKKNPAELVPIPTNTPADTPVPSLTPVNISAQITKTCFAVDTCSAGGSATSAVAEDKDKNIWVSEMSECSYFKKYNTSGTELFSTGSPMISGMTKDKTNNWIWYSYTFLGNAYIIAKDSNNITGTAKANITIPITTENYFRIGFDGTYVWVLYTDTSFNWQCVKYTTSGTSLGGFQVPAPVNSGYYWGITYGDGYLWLSSLDYTYSYGYIYKMDTSGSICAIYYLGFALYGIDWIAPNTFWAAMGSEVCKINF